LVIDFAERFDDGLRGIDWGREDFQHTQLAVVAPDTIGESAASVDGYAEGLRAAGHGYEFGGLG
jgi:hypothetical protein